MDYEIEFFAVGNESKAGDAIVARYGANGQYEVTIIDGGTEESGAAIVNHVRDVYGPDTIVSHVVSTHPDTDHASGLRTVLAELPVKNLWIHGLWYHAKDLMQFFADKRWTEDGLTKAIKAEYSIVDELINLAIHRGIPVYEPFEGSKIGPFTVLSPTRYAYQRLVPQFRKTPDPNVDLLTQQRMYLGAPKKPSLFEALLQKAAERAATWIEEKWHVELLKEGGITAAENETSVVLWGDLGTARVLLTADAGINALTWACDFAATKGIDPKTATLTQVPHHGSRRNISPTVLNRLLGVVLPAGSPRTGWGVVSAPKDDANHPRKMVLNAFLRRGRPVYKTQGVKFRYHSGTMPARRRESQAEPFGFFDKVEAYD
jgi:beta-lactamase superfamily II metal-dependent hydrolase